MMKDIEAGVMSEKHRNSASFSSSCSSSNASLQAQQQQQQQQQQFTRILQTQLEPTGELNEPSLTYENDEITTTSMKDNDKNNNEIKMNNDGGGGGTQQGVTSNQRHGVMKGGVVIEKPPSSGGSALLLPVINAKASKQQQQQQQQQVRKDPRLLHPLLLQVPLQFRFGMTGVMSNILFMVTYNTAVEKFSSQVQAPIIYGIVYFFFIPASHLMVSLMVFGWPDRYLASLLNNFPIGLTALAMGGVLTAYLDQIGFNVVVATYIRDNFYFSIMPDRDARKASHDEEGEFYSSILVLFITGLWTYVLSVYVNSPRRRKSHEKEL